MCKGWVWLVCISSFVSDRRQFLNCSKYCQTWYEKVWLWITFLPDIFQTPSRYITTSDRDRHFFRDPSSSISDRSQIDQTGTTTTLLCLAVIMYSHRWRNLIYSRSWDYKASFHNYNTNNGLILARHVGWGMHSSYFIRILAKKWLAISETMTYQIVWEV